MSEAVCRARARQLLAEIGVAAPPVDVEGVARALGLRVRLVSGGRGLHGRLLRQRLEIEVDRAADADQRRFTIAHEVGHFLLGHSPVVGAFDPRSAGDPYRHNEWQADSFACELLMPEPWVRERWPGVREYRALARLFAVAPAAMFDRLEDLGLLRLERRYR
jgi:hypothetical protein